MNNVDMWVVFLREAELSGCILLVLRTNVGLGLHMMNEDGACVLLQEMAVARGEDHS